jgi:hypothetical protein
LLRLLIALVKDANVAGPPQRSQELIQLGKVLIVVGEPSVLLGRQVLMSAYSQVNSQLKDLGSAIGNSRSTPPPCPAPCRPDNTPFHGLPL